MALDHKTRITNPVGMALIWNYIDRIDANLATDPNSVESRVIINSASLKSISTSKSKSSPAGSFEIRLAPTFNWVTRITVGSWIVLLMSPEQDIGMTSNVFPNFVDEKTFKMLGRINSVRLVTTVDPETGARITEYIVEGNDWGSVFNTKLYMDPVARNNNFEEGSAVGHAARILLDNMITDWVTSGDPLPSSSEVTTSIIELWGDPLTLVKGAFSKIAPEILLSSQSQFKLPSKVAIFMKLKSGDGIPINNFASLIKPIIDGKLTGDDTYGGDPKEAFGFPNPSSFFGTHTFWQLLIDNCNTTINELIAETRFTNGSPKLALYKRVKPFITDKSFINPPYIAAGEDLDDVISEFKHVKKIEVPYEEVISINVGTNWRDKVNFIEILPQPLLNQTNLSNQVKQKAQAKDLKAFERDGFKPLIEKVNYMPYTKGAPQPIEATKWKHVLQQWYFNTHNLLNGAATFIGRQEYIQVGDNIKINAKVFGAAPFNAGQSKFDKQGTETYLLAQIENVSNNFTVDGNGARSFLTTVQFTRGLITDTNGKSVGPSGALDKDAETLINTGEKDIHDTFGTSTESDPDIQKLKGT
jgi:hypothetical protein